MRPNIAPVQSFGDFLERDLRRFLVFAGWLAILITLPIILAQVSPPAALAPFMPQLTGLVALIAAFGVFVSGTEVLQAISVALWRNYPGPRGLVNFLFENNNAIPFALTFAYLTFGSHSIAATIPGVTAAAEGLYTSLFSTVGAFFGYFAASDILESLVHNTIGTRPNANLLTRTVRGLISIFYANPIIWSSLLTIASFIVSGGIGAAEAASNAVNTSGSAVVFAANTATPAVFADFVGAAGPVGAAIVAAFLASITSSLSSQLPVVNPRPTRAAASAASASSASTAPQPVLVQDRPSAPAQQRADSLDDLMPEAPPPPPPPPPSLGATQQPPTQYTPSVPGGLSLRDQIAANRAAREAREAEQRRRFEDLEAGDQSGGPSDRAKQKPAGAPGTGKIPPSRDDPRDRGGRG